MGRTNQVLLQLTASLAILALNYGHLVDAKDLESKHNNELKKERVDNLQREIDIPEDVLLNTLYYLTEDSEYTPEARGIPIYFINQLDEPKYIEIKLKPRGYILASLTKDDFPVVRFNGEDLKIPSEILGEAYKYVIYDESYDISTLDTSGNLVKSLSNLNGIQGTSDSKLHMQREALMLQDRKEEADEKWSHDYVMKCNRDHAIVVCSDKFGENVEQLTFPYDFGQATSLRTSGGAVWDGDRNKFVESEKKGDSWVKGTTDSHWERSHISLDIERRVGKCGMAKLNVPCDAKIYDKPIWIGNTRITIVDEIQEDEEEEASSNSVRKHLRASWSAWSSWSTYSADDYATVPNYNQHSCCGCVTGCGAVAWAQLFGWADIRSDFSDTIYDTAAIDAPAAMTSDVENYIEDIREEVNTFCSFGSGATFPWSMNNVKTWFQGRGGGDLKTSYSPIGWRRSKYRNCAKDEIRYRKRPVVIGTGWLTHYPTATRYRVRTRTKKVWWGRTKTDTDHEVFLHQGWGGAGNGWENLSTWFCGTIDP